MESDSDSEPLFLAEASEAPPETFIEQIPEGMLFSQKLDGF